MKELDSNNLKTDIHVSCFECGVSANVLTCMKKYGKRPDKLCYSISTYSNGVCDYCGEEKEITQTRDFFYPDYSLLNLSSYVAEALKE